jgi:hypothetical protein
MAAKSGIFDFILKGGSKAVKEMSKGTAKSPSSNMKVVKPETLTGTRGTVAKAQKYYAETGRPKVVNGRPIPPSMLRPTPAKKAVPAKKVAPVKKAVPSQSPLRGTTLSSRDVVGRIPKSVIAKARKAEAANKAAYSKSLAKPLEMKKPAPAKKAVPVKKAQPGRVSPETARKLAVMNKNKTYTQRRDAVRMLPAKPPVKKFR